MKERGLLFPVRSRAGWAARIILAFGLATLGVEACRQSVAAAILNADPQRASTLAPRNGRVLGRWSQSLWNPKSSAADRRTADQLAVQALRADPTALTAAVTLGLEAELQGDIARARRIFAYSEKLSRRDLRTQIWAIEAAVARGDVHGALRHYNIALRTSRQAPDILFPVLGSAISDAGVRLELARIMVTQPRWNELFIPYVAGNGTDPRAVVSLFRQIADGQIVIPPPSQAIAIARLIVDHPEQAWAYYASIRTDAQRMRSRDPRFTAAIVEPLPFDWTPAEDANVSVSVQRARDGGTVEFSLPSGTGGMVLSQLQFLPPGKYDLGGHSADIAQAPGARPYWLLTCEGSGRELGRVVLPDSSQFGGRFAGQLSVQGDCPVQRLSLIARPSDRVEGLVGRINEVQLQPARTGGR